MKHSICVECMRPFDDRGRSYRIGDRVTVDRWVAAAWVGRGLVRVVESWVQGAPERKARRQERRADRRERRAERRQGRAQGAQVENEPADTHSEPESDTSDSSAPSVSYGGEYMAADWRPGKPLKFAGRPPLDDVPWYDEDRGGDKARVYEIARAVGHTSAAVIAALNESGVEVTSQMSSVDVVVADSYVRLHRGE